MTNVASFFNSTIHLFVQNHRYDALDSFAIDLQLNTEVSPISIYQFYKCLNARFTHKTDFQNSDTTFVLVWCLKQAKDLTLEFLISGSFLSEKTTYWWLYYNIVFFPLGSCEHEFIDSQANYQGCRYDFHFLRCHAFSVINFVNGEGVC